MKSRTSQLRIALVVACVSMLTAIVYAFADDEGERELSLKDAPAAIQKAFNGIDVSEVELERRDGKDFYTVEFRVDDDDVELRLTSDGVLLGVEIEHGDDHDGEVCTTSGGGLEADSYRVLHDLLISVRRLRRGRNLDASTCR